MCEPKAVGIGGGAVAVVAVVVAVAEGTPLLHAVEMAAEVFVIVLASCIVAAVGILVARAVMAVRRWLRRRAPSRPARVRVRRELPAPALAIEQAPLTGTVVHLERVRHGRG